MKPGYCAECAVEVRHVKARGLCTRHYNIWLATHEERAWKKTEYPSDDAMVSMCADIIALAELARKIGVSREALRDYLSIRPELKEAVNAALNEGRDEIMLSRDRASKDRWKKNNPDKVREINRRWAKNQHPSQRAKWNNYNRNRRRGNTSEPLSEDDRYYYEVVLGDPCSYCSKVKEVQTIDHIQPVSRGGSNFWNNVAGACRSCNSSKNDDTLLRFLIRRAVEADIKREKSNA